MDVRRKSKKTGEKRITLFLILISLILLIGTSVAISPYIKNRSQTNRTSLSAVSSNSKKEITGSSGWYLSAESVCQDGKAFIKYTYKIPKYRGMLLTSDTGIFTDSKWSDSSWYETGSNITLLKGNGVYVAKGNVDMSSGIQQFNPKPVGFVKGENYRADLIISGNWNCVGGATCLGDSVPLPEEFGQVQATLSVRTLTLQECPDITPTDTLTPTSTLKPKPTVGTVEQPTKKITKKAKITCNPDPRCIKNLKVLQICKLICQ